MNQQVLSVEPDEKWFKQIPKYSPNKDVPSPDTVFALKAEAENLLDSEVKVYHKLKENKRDKDFVWIKKILKAGTLSDKISAHTLLIQDCPVYNLNSLEVLIGMVNTKGKRECLMAMDSLRDLFIGNLLIEDKKLKYFNEQPLSQINEICQDSATRKRCLILWLFENILKGLYKKFLTSVDKVSHDTIEKTKIKAVSVLHKLLEENPEEEQFLLDHLVNKIGDPIPKIGSHVCFLLGKLLNTHKHMKSVVVQEVERLIFRQNLAERAKYYSLCFLNQIILSHDDFKIANQLILIYFSQFKLFVKKGEVNNKMMSALLSGVARAYPYAKLRDNIVMDQMDAMYRLVHLVSFNISIQALMLIFQVLDSSDSVSDRFYGALYRKLLDTSLATSSKQAFFLNLVYKALKKDVAVVRIKAFVKRLLQIALYQPPNLQCGILVLISEVNKLHPNLLEIKHSIPDDSDSDEHYEDVVEVNEDNKVTVKVEKHEPGSSWVHKHESKKQKTKSVYDLDCRNPLHANPNCQAMWELVFLKQSFHPSVSLFANQVSNSSEIKYGGDPLLDFTNARFLDRFVYRNPKKISESLEMNPTTRVFGSRKFKASASKQLHVTSNEYLQQKSVKIPEDEKFIYQYLRNRTVTAKSLKEDSDLDSVCSDEFEQLLDNIHPEDDGEDTLDFAKELGMQKGNKRKVEDSDDEPDDVLDDDEDEDFDGDLDDEEIEFEDDAFDDLNEEDLCEEDFVGGISKRPPKKKSKSESLTDGQLLADADEFSALLEENAGTKLDTLTGQAFKIKDKSSVKQIAWEMERDRFIKGQKWQKRKKSFKRNKKSRN
ncbi:CCAAT/enhancer-binding protein zeta [Parasteatoda tepidariorum]|uniref:CCAAT/enhancer-binding protein zeta n=1 Tax=Parasteatoda tepidariorum TaxID=114398 RepID=UPI001C729665|nr:CCAAT/enhancer-binding protein zeta isoform X1 [Parasteatoda tepidariorum]